MQRLLAAQLPAGVVRIAHRDHQLVRPAAMQGAAKVEGEGIVPATVGAQRFPVDEDLGAPVDGAEMQHDAVLKPRGGDGKLPPVPQPLIRQQRLHHPGQG